MLIDQLHDYILDTNNYEDLSMILSIIYYPSKNDACCITYFLRCQEVLATDLDDASSYGSREGQFHTVEPDFSQFHTTKVMLRSVETKLPAPRCGI